MTGAWGDDMLDLYRDDYDGPLMTFGKYKGEPVAKIVAEDPRYALWAHKNVSFFKLNAAQIQECVIATNVPPWLPKGAPDDDDGPDDDYGGLSYADFGNN